MSTESKVTLPEAVREHDEQIDQHIIDVREKLKAGTKFLLYSDVTCMISEILLLRRQRDDPGQLEAAAQQERARLHPSTAALIQRARKAVATTDMPEWVYELILALADAIEASHPPPTPEDR